MDLGEITRIVELMAKHDLTEFDIKSDDLALTIKRERPRAPDAHVTVTSGNGLAAAAGAAAPAPNGAYPAGTGAGPAAPAAPPPSPPSHAVFIKSPLVGTFYSSSAPDAEPFVRVGDRVKADTVVCIVEAMKVMNEIKAEKGGVIQEILAENGKPVEFDQELFRLAP